MKKILNTILLFILGLVIPLSAYALFINAADVSYNDKDDNITNVNDKINDYYSRANKKMKSYYNYVENPSTSKISEITLDIAAGNYICMYNFRLSLAPSTASINTPYPNNTTILNCDYYEELEFDGNYISSSGTNGGSGVYYATKYNNLVFKCSINEDKTIIGQFDYGASSNAVNKIELNCFGY